MYLLIYDFKGARTNKIPRQFYRALDILLAKRSDVTRVQNSAFLCESEQSAYELRALLEKWEAEAKMFEVVKLAPKTERPEAEPIEGYA